QIEKAAEGGGRLVAAPTAPRCQQRQVFHVLLPAPERFEAQARQRTGDPEPLPRIEKRGWRRGLEGAVALNRLPGKYTVRARQIDRERPGFARQVAGADVIAGPVMPERHVFRPLLLQTAVVLAEELARDAHQIYQAGEPVPLPLRARHVAAEHQL